MSVEERLQKLGIQLPEPAAAVANYLPYVKIGDLVSVSGQVGMGPEGLRYVGKVGETVTLDEAVAAARLCGIGIIAQLKAACDGDLERVLQIVKLTGFVHCVDDYTNQPLVINGASDLMVEVFGEPGRHSRSAVGVSSLPLNVPVEIDALAVIEL